MFVSYVLPCGLFIFEAPYRLLPESVIPSLPQFVSIPADSLPEAKFRLNRSLFLLFLPKSAMAYGLFSRPPTTSRSARLTRERKPVARENFWAIPLISFKEHQLE
jgi:hypothetical protein